MEKLIQPTVEVTRPLDYLIDGMYLVQKLKVDWLTFGETVEKILSRVCARERVANRVEWYLTFTGESDAVAFKNLAAGQKVKKFNFFTQW